MGEAEGAHNAIRGRENGEEGAKHPSFKGDARAEGVIIGAWQDTWDGGRSQSRGCKASARIQRAKPKPRVW